MRVERRSPRCADLASLKDAFGCAKHHALHETARTPAFGLRGPAAYKRRGIWVAYRWKGLGVGNGGQRGMLRSSALVAMGERELILMAEGVGRVDDCLLRLSQLSSYEMGGKVVQGLGEGLECRTASLCW